MIEFEEDEESEEEPEPMETDQPSTIAESSTGEQSTNEPTVTTTSTAETITQKDNNVTTATTDSVTATAKADGTTEATKVANKEDSIPGGPSSLLNKAISTIQHEDSNSMEEDVESRSQTPKLDDISDEEPDPSRDVDDDDDDDNDVNNPSKHPALAPHAQVHTTDDDMTDSAAATPQTEVTTPMPGLDDDDMMGEPTQATAAAAAAHPLSQEILTGIIAQDDMSSLNNDSPAIQTPEDTIPVTHPHNPIEDN